MWGWRCAGAAFAAGMFVANAAAEDVVPPAELQRRDATILESSARLRLTWTEIAFRSNRPKAWDQIVAPEFRTSLRVLAGLFEGKVEIGAAGDRFAHFSDNSVDVMRGELQLGINTGDWSYLLEWKTRDVFELGYDDFMVGLNTYDARIRYRFTLDLIDDAPPALVQASAAAGYVAALPHLFARNFAELELEMVQRLANGFAVMVAPKLELSDYLDFPGGPRRDDALIGLRIVPTYNLGGGLTLSVEGQATIALSTRDTKTGEIWELTPILRLQKAL